MSSYRDYNYRAAPPASASAVRATSERIYESSRSPPGAAPRYAPATHSASPPRAAAAASSQVYHPYHSSAAPAAGASYPATGAAAASSYSAAGAAPRASPVSAAGATSAVRSAGSASAGASAAPVRSSGGAVRPIPFIKYHDHNGQFEVTREAKAMLSAVQGRIAVVAVAGIYRTGKSYILNALAGKQSGQGGFQTGSTVQACTKGIWVWGEPIQTMGADGQPVSLLLLDTEGIASLERSEESNIQIFSLALLLSSSFLYNSMSSIDESAIDRLSMVAEVTRRIKRHAGDRDGDAPAMLAEFFPNFIWLLRDFALQLVDKDGRTMTADQYLEQAFAPQPGDSARVVERNNIRTTLRTVFPQRQCITLVRPTHAEADLARMSELSVSQLRPEFVQQLNYLKKVVGSQVKPKMIMGQALNGAALCGMADSYVEAINKGAVPTIMSAWENVATLACHEALDEARTFYLTGIRRAVQSGDLSWEEFERTHQGLLKAALEKFHTKAIGMNVSKFEQKLRDDITHEYESIKKTLEKQVGQVCAKILDELWFQLSNVQYNSSEEFAAALKHLFTEYNAKAPRTLAKLDVLYKFLAGNFSDVISKYVRTHETAAKAALAKQKKMRAEFEQYSERQAQETQGLQQRLQQLDQEVGRARQADAESQRLKSTLAQREERLQHLEREHQEQQQTLSHRLREMENQINGHRQREQDLLARVRQLEDAANQASQLSSRLNRAETEKEQIQRLAHQERAEREAVVSDRMLLESELSDMSATLSSTKSEISGLLREIMTAEQRMMRNFNASEGY